MSLLTRHEAFRAASAPELLTVVEGSLKARVMAAPAPQVPLLALAGAYDGPSGQLWYCSYGAPIAIAFPEGSEDFVRVQVRQDGTGVTAVGNDNFEVSAAQACVSGGAVKILFPPGFTQLVWRPDRRYLTARLAAIAGRPIAGPLQFESAFDLRSAPGRAFATLLRGYAEVLDAHPAEALRLVVPDLESALSALLLAGARHRHGHLLDQPAPAIAPREVRRAEAYIAANLDKPLRIEALATVAGASTRSLFRTFKEVRGYTPLQFIKQRRLERARDLLLEGAPGAQVTEVALACGYGDLSRFSRDYARAFGEPPSATRRRRRT